MKPTNVKSLVRSERLQLNIRRKEGKVISNYGVSLICRNEEDNIEECIRSIYTQTVKPVKVVVVDDGSTDRTSEILKKLSYEYDNLFYRTVNIPRLGLKGLNISMAIRLSLEEILSLSEVPYILRMDSDVKLDSPGLVKHLITEMERDSSLGITGAVSNNFRFMPRHVTDAVRLYRRGCLSEVIASFPNKRYPVVHGHDSVMIFRARWLGWTIRPTRVYFNDKRPYRRRLKQWFALGLFRHVNGYPFSYVAISTVQYINTTPYILGSLTAFLTYVIGFITNVNTYEEDYKAFMHKDLTETVVYRIRNVKKRFNVCPLSLLRYPQIRPRNTHNNA